MLLRLRQICSHTSLITEEKDVIVDDNLEDADKNDEDELIQAHRVAGPDFVNKLKTKLREVAVERIAAEKEVSFWFPNFCVGVNVRYYCSRPMRPLRMKNVRFALTCSISRWSLRACTFSVVNA